MEHRVYCLQYGFGNRSIVGHKWDFIFLKINHQIEYFLVPDSIVNWGTCYHCPINNKSGRQGLRCDGVFFFTRRVACETRSSVLEHIGLADV